MRLDEGFLQIALPEIEIISKGSATHYSFSIDTRTLKTGDIFVAIKGKQVDGHQFLTSALERGASGILIAEDKRSLLQVLEKSLLKNKFIALVPNTLDALLRLAAYWRAQFTIPVIGITGSFGKTSTKETLSKILTVAGINHLVSHANENTKIGIALNLLRLKPEHKVAVLEVGISQRGEMAESAQLLKPTTAIITNIGHCHMEGLGFLPDIALEKRDIFKYFTENDIGIINGDVPLLASVSYIHPVIKFGSKRTNQIQARKISLSGTHTTFILKIYKEKCEVEVPKAHEGVVYSILAASACAYLLNVPTARIMEAIAQPVEVSGRFQECSMKLYPGVLINDCYNANPESMKAALLAFEKLETNRQKIAVLGDMLELGSTAPFWHRQLGRFLRKAPSIKKVILVGDMVKWIKKTAPVTVTIEHFTTWQEALRHLKTELITESVVLLKASHGMQLHNIVTALKEGDTQSFNAAHLSLDPVQVRNNTTHYKEK